MTGRIIISITTILSLAGCKFNQQDKEALKREIATLNIEQASRLATYPWPVCKLNKGEGIRESPLLPPPLWE